jgi:hypothetical protein
VSRRERNKVEWKGMSRNKVEGLVAIEIARADVYGDQLYHLATVAGDVTKGVGSCYGDRLGTRAGFQATGVRRVE